MKTIAYSVVFVVIVIVGLGAYVLFNDDSYVPTESLDLIDQETKFPLASYMRTEPKEEPKPQTSYAPPPPPPATTEEVKKTLAQIKENAKKYDMSIFPDEEDRQRRELERKRQAMLASRMGAPIQSRAPANTFTPPKKIKEYGADQFSNLNVRNDGSNEHKLLRTITADRMIPAILINPITSDLAGKVTAQVEEDIFAAMGRAVLIPKGSRVIGEYKNNNKLGENRLGLIWTRIITPHGINIMLTKAQSTDVTGQSGVIGELDNKYWERYGLALTLSTLANSIMIVIANETQKYPNNQTQNLLDKSGNDISTIINNIIKEQIKVNPTIHILAGSRVFINPTVDIWLPEPKEGEIMARYFNETKN